MLWVSTSRNSQTSNCIPTGEIVDNKCLCIQLQYLRRHCPKGDIACKVGFRVPLG